MFKHLIVVFSLLFLVACSENYADSASKDASARAVAADFKLASAGKTVLVDANPSGEVSFIQTESIGGLQLGMSPTQFIDLLPCTVVKSDPVLLAGIGEIIQEWSYPDCGVRLQLSTSDSNTPQKVFSIKVSEPGKMKTSRKIGIGSDFEAVLDAYLEYADQADNQAGETFLAGSADGGLSIKFKDNRVVSLFLGAGAE